MNRETWGLQKGYEQWELYNEAQIELQQLRKSQLHPAKKFMGNSVIKQLRHMETEFEEIAYEMERSFTDDKALAMEVIDLQMSCQTFLEGSMGLSKEQIAKYIQEVISKNEARGYNRAE